ncbi:Ger(x)C family spore germination protein [Ammoniphilus sp. 3BR4]|uniref:Ger(x)C family spore germination protein n=1 Tax=Ammoniphilus sp. 3BR4 TaxID=3158265 RepID=UPI003464FCB4
MKKGIQIIGLLLLLSLLSGCWDARELGDITVVTGMGIDKGERKRYKLTIEGMNAAELNNKTARGDAPSIVYSLEGDTIAELSQKMNTAISRKTVYSHVRTVVISQELARTGLLEFLDFLERNREIRDDFMFLLSEGKAEDILKVTYPIQKASSLKIAAQLPTMAQNWGGDPDIRLKHMIDAATSPGRSPVLTKIRIQGEKEKGGSVENMKKVDPNAIVVVDGLAVFKDDRYIGDLNMGDSRNYLLIQGDVKLTSFTIPCGNKNFLAVRVYNASSKRKVEYFGGTPHAKIELFLEGRLDSTQCGDDLSKPETYVKYEKMMSKSVSHEVESTIKRVQKKFQVDAFGFGDDLNRQHFEQFEKVKDNWNEEFARMKVDVHTTVMLRRAGIRTKSFLKERK